jgi:hypothetical protein
MGRLIDARFRWGLADRREALMLCNGGLGAWGLPRWS